MPHYTTFDAHTLPAPAQVVNSIPAATPKPPVQLAPQVVTPPKSEGVAESQKQIFIKTLQGKTITVSADGSKDPVNTSSTSPAKDGHVLPLSSSVKALEKSQVAPSILGVMPPIDETYPKSGSASQSSGGTGGLLFGNGGTGGNGASSEVGSTDGTGGTGGTGGKGGNGPAMK